MKCNNCGALLNGDTSVCPSCGASIFKPEENEVIKITENMAPPELTVNQEQMSVGAGDLSNGDNVNTYSPEVMMQQASSDTTIQPDQVDFSIPTASAPAIDVDMPSDGSAPVVDNQESIVTGEIVTGEERDVADDLTKLSIGGKTFSIKMGKRFGLPVVLIVAVLTLIIGVFVGKILFSKNYCATTNKNSVVNTKTKYVSDGKNNIANIGSFTYKIPHDYTYDKTSKGLLILDKNDSFRIFIRTDRGSIVDMSGAKTSIRETLKENGTNVNDIKELNVNSVNFLIIETSYKNINRLVTFSDASNDYVFYIEIVDSNNNYNYEVLNIAADIIKNATYEERTSNMENIEINDIYDLTLKASLEYKALINR